MSDAWIGLRNEGGALQWQSNDNILLGCDYTNFADSAGTGDYVILQREQNEYYSWRK